MPESKSIPRPEQPRPDWDRAGPWTNLNGEWSFAFDDSDAGLEERWYERSASDEQTFNRRIVVPFAFQTAASGIGERRNTEVVWYARQLKPEEVDLDSEAAGSSAQRQWQIHFGAVDYEATVWINGRRAAHHVGGHVPFSADVDDDSVAALQKGEEVQIVLRVQDRLQDLTQPRGKQYWRAKSESIFYTPTTGIWQTVHIRSVPKLRLERAILLPDIETKTLAIDAQISEFQRLQNHSFRATASLGRLQVASTSKSLQVGTSEVSLSLDMTLTGTAPPEDVVQQATSASGAAPSSSSLVPDTISGETWAEGIALWSPERPALYDVVLEIVDARGAVVDSVKTYTGMRKISVDDGLVKLNNKPYFQRLVLDQGYWPESGMTAPDDEAYRQDILKMKELGINGARKHQKVEDPRFLYWADRLGFLVWGEMANAYQFSQGYMERFAQEWTAAVRRDMNHPCIVTWVPVNESWAHPAIPTKRPQAGFLRALYWLTKSIDPSRPVVDNDGWEHVQTDLMTVHDYAAADELAVTASSKDSLLDNKAGRPVAIPSTANSGQPILLSEFGGIAIDLSDKEQAKGDSDWGYQTASSEDDLLQRIKALIDAVIDGGIVQGYCYTQHSDVEQEVNGFLTSDREFKLDPKKLRDVLGRKSRFEP